MRSRAAACGLLVLYLANASAQVPLATGPEAEATREGLHRVDPRVMDRAWVDPELNLSHYTSLLVMPTVVTFRDVSGRYHPKSDTGSENFPVNERDRERMRSLFGEAVPKYISQVKPYETVDNVGRYVLMVHAYLVDVVSGVPPIVPGSSVTFVKRPWESTVMLEIRDSMSDDLLARTMDRQRVEGMFEATEIYGTTKWIVEEWSDQLRGRLMELIEIGGGRWTQCDAPESDCSLPQ